MKKQKAILVAIILAISIAVSGCIIDFDNVKSQIQGLTINENTEKETSDVIVIKDVKTLPVSPVFSDQTVRLYFTIKNMDTERTVNNVHIELYDPSLFKGSYQASECSGSCSLSPLSEKTVFFDLTAPSAEEIVNTKSTKRISFKVSYDYDSTTIYDVVVVNKDEIDKQQQAGKTVTVNPNKIMGSGPIKVVPDLMGDYSLLSGVTGTVRFVIQNQGTGMLKGNEISAGNFKIIFPYSFSPTGYAISESLFDKISEFTGNFILMPTGNAILSATGMATVCSELCGADATGPAGNSCANGCSCFFNSECTSGYCMPYAGGESGGTCQTYTTTTEQSICPCSANYYYGSRSCANGCACFSNSDCISNYCKDPTQEYPGSCNTPTTISSECGCASSYGTGTGACAAGCTCFHNSDCISGSCENLDPENGGGTCSSGTSNAMCGKTGCGLVFTENCDPNEICTCSILGCSCTADSRCTQTITTTTTETSHTVATARPSRVTTSTTPFWNKVQPTKFFSCSGDTCTNSQAIELFDGESSPMTFALTGNSDNSVYQVYTIIANTTYTYEVIDYIDVEVKPMGISDNAEPGGY